MLNAYHLRCFLWILIACQITGCASFYTSKDQYAGTARMLERQEYRPAYTQIEAAKNISYKSKDRVLFYLDAGMLLHYAGDWAKSNEYLTEAERGISELYTRSISRAAASFLLNDNVLSYSGEDYEDIYLNLFKALNYHHLNQPDEAFVEIRAAEDKIKALENKYGALIDAYNEAPEARIELKKSGTQFRDSAIDRWMSMLMYRADNRPDDARIDQRKIDALWQQQPAIYPFAKPSLSRALTPPPAGKYKFNILCFTGQGIEKEAVSIYLHTEENHLIIGATQENEDLREFPKLLQPIYWEGITEGMHFKFQYPKLKTRGTNVRSIRVTVNNSSQGQLAKIEDLALVAKEGWKARMPMIIAKTLTRATLKAVASQKAKDKMKAQLGDGGTYLLMRLLLDAGTSATENADLRVSRFFPAEAHIAELELPAGTHQLNIEYLGRSGAPLFVDQQEITIQPGQLNLAESVYLN